MQVLSTHVSDARGTNALKRALADIDAPGWCVAFGDRPDMLKAALDERYSGKKIVHVGGGETRPWTDSAHPDHKTRDALSAMSNVWCVANQQAAENLRDLGIADPYHWPVFITGCPSLDEVVALSKTPKDSGGEIYWRFPLVHIHPHPSDRTASLSYFEEAYETARRLLGEHIRWSNWLTPNNDDGGYLAELVEKRCPHRGSGAQVLGRLSEEGYLRALRWCKVFISNSSAVRREAPILGTPCIEIGDRQAGRAPAGTYHHPEGRACEEIARICREVCK